jgi:hypothetical protein
MRKLQNARKADQRKFDGLVFWALDRSRGTRPRLETSRTYATYSRESAAAVWHSTSGKSVNPNHAKLLAEDFVARQFFELLDCSTAEPSREARTRKGLVAGGREDRLPKMTRFLSRVVSPCQKSQTNYGTLFRGRGTKCFIQCAWEPLRQKQSVEVNLLFRFSPDSPTRLLVRDSP